MSTRARSSSICHSFPWLVSGIQVPELLDQSECLCMSQMGIKELSELQNHFEKLKEENKKAEVKLLMEQGLSREKVCFKVGNE